MAPFVYWSLPFGNRPRELSAKLTEGLTTPPSKIEDFAHLPLHRGGFGAVRNG